MSLLSLLVLLLLAAISGGVAQRLVGYTHGGCFASIAVGFIGALLATWLVGRYDLPEFFWLTIDADTQIPVIWSVIGSIAFVAVLSLLLRGRQQQR